VSARLAKPLTGERQGMTALPTELRELIEVGPLACLTTTNADGSPQVSVIWIGNDGDDLVSGHMSHYLKLRNIERDPALCCRSRRPMSRASS
jgi:predicted pyridoxine 5'-phosphate oxidase superfamily flavin-nucleotide-binding protein